MPNIIGYERRLIDLLNKFPQLPIKFMVSNELACDFDYTLHRIEKVEHTWIREVDEKVFVGFNKIKEELEELLEEKLTDEEIKKYAIECILIYTAP
jgi:hypothetical protein